LRRRPARPADAVRVPVSAGSTPLTCPNPLQTTTTCQQRRPFADVNTTDQDTYGQLLDDDDKRHRLSGRSQVRILPGAPPGWEQDRHLLRVTPLSLLYSRCSQRCRTWSSDMTVASWATRLATPAERWAPVIACAHRTTRRRVPGTRRSSGSTLDVKYSKGSSCTNCPDLARWAVPPEPRAKSAPGISGSRSRASSS
jgi:hypothetical protein